MDLQTEWAEAKPVGTGLERVVTDESAADRDGSQCLPTDAQLLYWTLVDDATP